MENCKGINEIFRATIDVYKIEAKRLSECSGVAPQQISEFKNGKRSLTTESLWQLLEGMARINPNARDYFCERLAKKEESTKYLLERIETIPMEDLADVMRALAARLSKHEPIYVISGERSESTQHKVQKELLVS